MRDTAQSDTIFYKQIPTNLYELEESTVEQWDEWCKVLSPDMYKVFAEQLPGASFLSVGQRLRQAVIESKKQDLYPQGRAFSPNNDENVEGEENETMFHDNGAFVGDFDDGYAVPATRESRKAAQPPNKDQYVEGAIEDLKEDHARELRKATQPPIKKMVGNKASAEQGHISRRSTRSTSAKSTPQPAKKTASTSNPSATKDNDMLIKVSIHDFNTNFVGRYMSYNCRSTLESYCTFCVCLCVCVCSFDFQNYHIKCIPF